MKHYLFYTTIIAALLTSAGCSYEDSIDVPPRRLITLTASMPEESPTTRLTLTPDGTGGNHPNINLTWDEGDKVQFCLLQGDKKIKKTVTVSSISNGGKTGQFSIPLDGLSDDAPFDIYGIYGGSLDEDNPTQAHIPSPAGIAMALTLRQTGVNPSSPAVNAPFRHLGSLLCVTVKNTATTPLDFSGKEFVLEGLAPSGWAVYGTATPFDITAEAASFPDADKKTHVEFPPAASTVAAGASVQLWTWIVPVGTVSGYLKLTQDHNESTNYLHARIPEAGKAYYIEAEWDGAANLAFLSDSEILNPLPALYGSAVDNGMTEIHPTPENENKYATLLNLKAGDLSIAIVEDGKMQYLNPADGNGTLQDGTPQDAALQPSRNSWNIPAAGQHRIVINRDDAKVTFYSPAKALQPAVVTWTKNSDPPQEVQTTVTDLWLFGGGTGWGWWKGNCSVSPADPQILIYEGKALSSGDGVKFTVYGESDFRNVAYAFTNPLTSEGKRQDLSLALNTVGELHGGYDSETRNSYYKLPSGTNFIVLDLRNKTIIAKKK
jgi:hypothetical protein